MIRSAVIGAGHIAKQHLACLRELHGVSVEGVCDLSPASGEMAAERFGVRRAFTDHRRMLAEVRPDVVHVCTPVSTHVRLAADAIDAGAHVMIEKPAAESAGELASLLSLAGAKNRVVIENYNYLFNSQTLRIAGMMSDGTLGEVVHVEVLMALDILGPSNPFVDPNIPNPLRTRPGGVIADLLTHLVSLAHHFVGPATRADAHWLKRGTTAAPSDEMRSIATCERGTASLVFSSHAQPDLFWLRVHGTKARVSASLFETYLSVEPVRDGLKPLAPFRNGLDESKAARRGAFGGLWRKLGGGPAAYEGLWELIARFYRAIERGDQPPITPSCVLEVNQWIDQLKNQDRTVSVSL